MDKNTYVEKMAPSFLNKNHKLFLVLFILKCCKHLHNILKA